MQYTYSYTYWH